MRVRTARADGSNTGPRRGGLDDATRAAKHRVSMKTHAQVAVIGGGVVGASVLYHLTEAGWTDVVLLERSELTSGSTWHAAGGMHTLNSDPNVAKLQRYTIGLYRKLEEISGHSCGIHLTGGVMLADTAERLDWLKTLRAKGRYLDMELEFVDLAEANERMPLFDPRHFVGALYDANEGHVDPAGVTHAYAKAARVGGAKIYRHTRVTALTRRADGWQVDTEKGSLLAEHVVNAGGLWAREVGRMVGIELPLLAMEHQYLVTDDVPEVAAREREIAHAIDFAGEIYMRQEGKGVVLGTYERDGVPWSERETPWDFGHELLPSDLDRIAGSLEVAFEHFPALAEVGIKKVINGPFTFAPDGNPLVGPVANLPNFWVACGVMAGFSQGGGVGLALARWMVDGDPGLDVWAMDVARFGDFATPSYTKAKVRENYSRRFRISFPNEELSAARPLRTTPIYSSLKQANAVFGAAFGLEHALWFAPPGAEPHERPSFRRSNAHAPVAEECRAVRSAVGLVETSNFAKYEVSGPGAERWLERLLANRLPAAGRIALAPMLNARGRIIGDFTVARMAGERFLLFGSGIAESYHMRWFAAQLPARGVALSSRRRDMVGLSIAGPRARALLERVAAADVSAQAFRFLDIRAMSLGPVPALVGRISFTGDLGYEIWVSPDYQLALFERLRREGEDLGLRLFGARALNSLRLEKCFGTFTREYTPDFSPLEAGLERFVKLDKGEFTGRDALLRDRDEGPTRRLVGLVVDDAGVDAFADEPVLDGEGVCGSVTSGGYAHWSGCSMALGYVPLALAQDGAQLVIEILGERRPATVRCRPVFDPEGARMRG